MIVDNVFRIVFLGLRKNVPTNDIFLSLAQWFCESRTHGHYFAYGILYLTRMKHQCNTRLDRGRLQPTADSAFLPHRPNFRSSKYRRGG